MYVRARFTAVYAYIMCNYSGTYLELYIIYVWSSYMYSKGKNQPGKVANFAELGRNPVVVSTRFSLSMEMSRLTRDGTAELVSRNQILRRVRGQGNIPFPCSADHEQDWQPYPVDPYSAICDDHTYILYIHTYMGPLMKYKN